MNYLATTSPGFFDQDFTQCVLTGFTDETREVATGFVEVRVCNEAIVNGEPVPQVYTITYDCDSRVTIAPTVTTDAIAVGRCEVVDNAFTFLSSTVSLGNTSLVCDMTLDPGGDVSAGQTTTTCNEVPNIHFPKPNCSATDLGCLRNDNKLLESSLFWVLIASAVIIIVLIVILVVVAVEYSQTESITPATSELQSYLDFVYGGTTDNTYNQSLAVKKTQ